MSWPLPVNFDYIRTPNSFEVRFFRKAELLLDRLTSIFPGSSYKHEGDQTILIIRTPTNRNFVAKSYGNITYLDIYKEGANEPNFIPHPALKTSQPIAENKQDIKKTTEVDLQNLFRKVADYLGELKPDIQSTVVSFGESGLLLKYLNDPIAIYEYEQKVYIVVLKDEYPMLEKQLEEKYAIRLIKLKGAFALQLTPKLLTRAIVAKHNEGWQIEFGSFMPNGKSPQFFTRDGDTKIKLNREGVLDPIDVEGVLVFCTLSPDVFAPLEFSHRAVSVLATSAGAAFKVDLPEEITFDRDFITLSFEGGVLPQEKPRKLRFDLLNLSEPFLTSKQKLVESIVSSEDTDVQKRIDLIHLYLSQTFASEALSEIKALEKVNSDKDKSLVWWVLSGVASILEGGQDAEVLSTLFSLSNSDLEASAWYGFLMARIEQYKLPPYLEDFLANTIVGLPEPLRSLLLLSLADSLLSQGSADSAEVVLRHINDSYLSIGSIPLKQFLYLKVQRLKYGQKDKGGFKRLLRQSSDPTITARLITESQMVDWKSKEHFEYIDCLENIIPLLEGSLYHQQAVAYLFNYYSTMKNHLTSLEWAWVLKKHHKTAYEQIKTSVQGIIYEFMRNKGFEKQGLIYTLRIFERFVEELPSSPYIADFILDLTDKLHRIGLLQESIHLIENYIRREDVRLTLKKQQEVFFQLLDYYIKNEDEVKAKDLLSMISDRGEISKGDVEKKEVFNARIALLKDKTEEALAALQANHSLEGMKIKSSILWEKKNWSGVAAALEELVDKYGGQLNPEIRERYIVHLAAALVLNEEKYPAKNMGRQKTRLSIQNISQKYESVLSKYKALLHELTTEPHNSFQETLTRDVIKKEIDETNRLEKLFDELKAVPTN